LDVVQVEQCTYVITTITQTLQALTMLDIVTALELAMLRTTLLEAAPLAVRLRVRINK